MTMTKEEIEKLKDAIRGLMSAYNAKPLDEAGIGMWTLSLRDLPYNLVRAVIIKWTQTQKFLPKPNDIVQAVHRIRLDNLEKKRQAFADADRRDRQLNGETVDVEERIKGINDTIGNPNAGTLRATHDASGRPYIKEEIWLRCLMADTAHLGAPNVYVERAKRTILANREGIILGPMIIEHARKTLIASGIDPDAFCANS